VLRRVAHDPPDVVALLEANEVVLLRARGRGNLATSSAALATSLTEEVPPEQVVGHHFELHRARNRRASLQG